MLGTLLIYMLFMVEELRRAPVENMDEIMYFVNSTYRLLEFVVAYGVCVCVCNTLWTLDCDGFHHHSAVCLLQCVAVGTAQLAELPLVS